MKRFIAAIALTCAVASSAGCGRTAETPAAPEAPAPATAPAAAIDAAREAPGSSDGSQAAAPGAPAFAVLYPGGALDAPAVTASGPAGPGGLATYTSDADPDAVIAFHRARAEAAGLSSSMAMNQGEARAYAATNAASGANLQVVASATEAGRTSVQLSWSAGQ